MKYVISLTIAVLFVIILIIWLHHRNEPQLRPSHKVELTWNAGEGCDQQWRPCYYDILRRFCDTEIIQHIADHIIDLKYSDTDIVPGMCYDYSVVACYQSSNVCSQPSYHQRITIPRIPRIIIYGEQ